MKYNILSTCDVRKLFCKLTKQTDDDLAWRTMVEKMVEKMDVCVPVSERKGSAKEVS
jgi:hypothetical protein